MNIRANVLLKDEDIDKQVRRLVMKKVRRETKKILDNDSMLTEELKKKLRGYNERGFKRS